MGLLASLTVAVSYLEATLGQLGLCPSPCSPGLLLTPWPPQMASPAGEPDFFCGGTGFPKVQRWELPGLLKARVWTWPVPVCLLILVNGTKSRPGSRSWKQGPVSVG